MNRKGERLQIEPLQDLHKNPNATKLSLANNFTSIVEKHLHEGVSLAIHDYGLLHSHHYILSFLWLLRNMAKWRDENIARD